MHHWLPEEAMGAGDEWGVLEDGAEDDEDWEEDWGEEWGAAGVAAEEEAAS